MKIQNAQEKPFWMSSTLWINAAGILVIALDYLSNSNLIVDKDVIGILLGISNILNRFRNTAQPLTMTK